MSTQAVLALADGTLFLGQSIGIAGITTGEIIFNTAMSGYQEIITDPSYAQQFITFTYPHIGNVGANSLDFESTRVWASGVVINELSPIASNWRSTQTLTEFFQQQKVIAIAGIDTRALTHILRTKGAQNACIIAAEKADEQLDKNKAIEFAKSFSGLDGKDLAIEVSTPQKYSWEKPLEYPIKNNLELKYHIVVYDYGVKQNILRLLVERGCRLTVVPATTAVAEVLALKPDGVFLSNGPGDPAACTYAIKNIQELLEKNIPMFGICLGFQLLGLACGAMTEKMKFGHHGANHPVRCEQTNRVLITSQNHGFSVAEKTLPKTLRVTHRSLFDGTLQGIEHLSKPAFGFQGHPEASPGPHDLIELFDKFIELMNKVTTTSQ